MQADTRHPCTAWVARRWRRCCRPATSSDGTWCGIHDPARWAARAVKRSVDRAARRDPAVLVVTDAEVVP